MAYMVNPCVKIMSNIHTQIVTIVVDHFILKYEIKKSRTIHFEKGEENIFSVCFLKVVTVVWNKVNVKFIHYLETYHRYED